MQQRLSATPLVRFRHGAALLAVPCLGLGRGSSLAALHAEQVVSAAFEALAELRDLGGARHGAADLPAGDRPLADIAAVRGKPGTELFLRQADGLTLFGKTSAKGRRFPRHEL